MTSRREFLRSLVALAAAGLTFDPLSAMAMQDKERNCLVAGSNKTACIVDLDTLHEKHVEIGFGSHSFIAHPNDPAKFIAIQKWGPSAAEVDFEKGTARTIPSEEHYQFYGHGIYVPEHKAVFITRVDGRTGFGYLTGYDPETYKILHDVKVTPGALHECRRMADNTFLVASAGYRRDPDVLDMRGSYRVSPSSLVRVDLIGTGKVVGELAIKDPEQMINHIAVTKGGQILALSSAVHWALHPHGAVYYSPDGVQPLRALEFPEDMEPTQEELKNSIRMSDRGPVARSKEFLSAALNSDHTRAAVTYPIKKKIVLVDMTQGKVLKVANQASNGMAFDPSRNKFIGSGQQLTFVGDSFADPAPRPVSSHMALDSPHSLLLSSKIST